MKWGIRGRRERVDAAPDAAAFESVVLPHLDAAYNLARWLVGDPILAEDVVQDAADLSLGVPSHVPADPARPSQHDCCDECALLALAVLPAHPILSSPAWVEHYADHAYAMRGCRPLRACAPPNSPKADRPRDLTRELDLSLLDHGDASVRTFSGFLGHL